MKAYNINCDIARDLMPLVIDDAASEAAREAVEEHVEGCEDCRKLMADMRREERPSGEGGDTKFIQFCKKMEKRFAYQHIVAWVCGILAALLMVAGGWRLVRYQCYEHWVPMAFSQENPGDARLVQDQYGNVEIWFTVEDETRPYMGWSGRCDSVSDAAGAHVWYEPEQPAWPQWFGAESRTGEVRLDEIGLKIIDGQLMYVEYDSSYEADENGIYVDRYRLSKSVPVAEIRLGKIESEDALLLWQAGDPVDFPTVNIRKI